MSNPKGFRLNNPLNIRLTDDRWLGQLVSVKGDEFVRFDKPEHGIRAAAKLLQTYWSKYGIQSIEALVTRWAPEEDNNPTSDYIDFVAERSGIARDDIYDPFDYSQVLQILRAMARFELGKPPDGNEFWYQEATWERGLRLAGVVRVKSINPTKADGSRVVKGATVSTVSAVTGIAILTDLLDLPPEVVELLPTALSGLSEQGVALLTLGAVIIANLWVKWSRYDDQREGRL